MSSGLRITSDTPLGTKVVCINNGPMLNSHGDMRSCEDALVEGEIYTITRVVVLSGNASINIKDKYGNNVAPTGPRATCFNGLRFALLRPQRPTKGFAAWINARS